jgi:hypothetical protein
MADLSVLLRDGTNSGATDRLALKVEQLSLSYGRQPIQIPLPGASPIIIDLGQSRPTITISGIMDNIGGDLTNTTANAWFNMEKFTEQGQTYYVPYKNYLESKLLTWSTGANLEFEVGDATTPDYSGSGTTASTGGGIYKVAVTQFQFSQAPGLEDRWAFSIQFVAEWRAGIS